MSIILIFQSTNYPYMYYMYVYIYIYMEREREREREQAFMKSVHSYRWKR